MGVPGFYSWLTKRYPMIKHMIKQQSLPEIDYLYLDMNGIIYKCVKDDSVIFKSQLQPKQLEEIWIEIFNYINFIVDLLKPTKMILLALDGVAPRSKMNNQRSRRFRSAKDHKQYIERLHGFTQITQSQQNFKNNSISPGTYFMSQLNEMIHFFIQKKLEEDDYWKGLSIIFTGSDSPGEGQHKIMEFIRTNHASFQPEDSHCLYGADADLIMLGLTLPMKNLCIIREQYTHMSDRVQIMNSRKEKEINFQLIYLTILKECLDLEYRPLKDKMLIQYNIESIAKDFVFLFFFVGNDFLPRIYAYNIRQQSIQRLIEGFKNFLLTAQSYLTSSSEINLVQLLKLLHQIGKHEKDFFIDKFEEFQKAEKNSLKQQSTFEDQLQRRFLQNIVREEQTLLQLKQIYENSDGTGKINYYNSNFNIDPISSPDHFYNILAYYVYGLKFVYQYYFVNLPSWSWYYPYYFAPLLTDIQFYLSQLIIQGGTLQKFSLDQPFEPFKQLLCILPKESYELLPKNFQSYIVSENSILRSPFDFYPDQIESVTYGSLRAHESILLIPFIDQTKINQVYDKQIQNTSKQQRNRNILRLSRLYEFQQKGTQIHVQSPFKSIQSFNCKIIINEVNLLSKFLWKTAQYQNPINQGEEKLLKMPTLQMREFQFLPIKNRGNVRYYTRLLEPDKKGFKLGEFIFYGYPIEHSGRIEAILTKKQFMITSNRVSLSKYGHIINSNDFNYPEDIIRYPHKCFEHLIQTLQRTMHGKEQFYQFLQLSQVQTLFFVVNTQIFARNIEGQFVRQFKNDREESFNIIPACIASKQKLYRTTKNNFKFRSIEQEFAIGEKVLIISPSKKECGSQGVVVGYSKDNKLVRVQIKQKPKLTNQQAQKVLKVVSTKNDVFFTIKFAAAILQTRYDLLHNLLGSINVITPSSSQLPPSIDIGLNFVSRKLNMIVPNLVRINFYYDFDLKKDNPFKYIQFSVRALEILIEYKKKFPQIFQFMEKRQNQLISHAKRQNKKIQWGQPIRAEQIYQKDTIKSLMKIYIWLIEKEETHMPVSSIYSKQIQQKRISKLKQLVTQNKINQEKSKSKKKLQQPKILFFDPNYLFSHKLSKLGSVYLRKKPKNHQIGDVVICLRPEFFGHYGIIVGIDDNKYEVFFEQPSFGKNDLGGLCQNLWGYKFNFKEILNLQTWPQHFMERKKAANQSQKQGWVDQFEDFYPQYASKSLQDFQDVKVFTEKQQNKKYFSEGMLEYIFKVQSNLKQIEIDPEYKIVDNKKQQYRFKYDKKVSYIQKKQITEAADVIKVLDRPIVLTQTKEECEKQIIENKIADLALNENEPEQEDASYILG